MVMTKIDPVNANGDELKRIFSEGFSETMRKENLAGTWSIEQLELMEDEFNLLPASSEEQRFLLLNRFFHAKEIFHIIIGKFTLPSKDAHRIDLSYEKSDAMCRNDLPATKALSQFSKACYGPGDEAENECLLDEHVKTFLHSEIPPPYQRKYQDEPPLLASLRKCTSNVIGFKINIEHLVQTEGFCKCCVGHKHRQTLQAIPLSTITSIKLCLKENGFYDLVIKTK